MKILKEAKDNLPISFLTNFVSRGWDEVGILKEEIKAIKEEFKGTKKVEELIQNLIDAYLVCIGQVELHLANKDYLDFEPVSEESDNKLKEDLIIIQADETPDMEDDTTVLIPAPIVDPKETTTVAACNSCAESTEDDFEPEEAIEDTVNTTEEPFEYFCDFDDIKTEPLSDDEIALMQNNLN